jgi:CheY-like chemotaxis protein
MLNLDSRKTNLRPIILGIMIAKMAIAFWSLQGILQIIYFRAGLPMNTLPSRLGLLVAPYIQLWNMTRLKHPPIIHSIPGPFNKRKTDDNKLKVVLIVEDDLDLAEIYQEALDPERFAVEVVWNGEAGLAAMEKFQPDLLIIDIKLPGINGIQFLVLARLAGFKGKAIGVSGLAGEIDKEKLKDFEIVLQKPFRIGELINAVEVLTSEKINERRRSERDSETGNDEPKPER